MSRLGDLIRTERLRSKMTPKQVARKCGVSESYLLAVEAGTKIWSRRTSLFTVIWELC